MAYAGEDVCGIRDVVSPRRQRSSSARRATYQDAVLDEARPKVRYINNVITPAGPKHGHMAHEETRLLTFQDWPQAMPQKPQDLAEAGFFYLGRGDFAQCFYCSIGLRNWDPNDTPWVEHARWSPDCVFVLLVKGQSFVKTAQRSQPISHEQEESNNEDVPPVALRNENASGGLPVRAESDPTELLKENTRLREERLCRICYDREANIVFVPCGHLATCGKCASAFRDCPVCRAPIRHAVKTFMA